MNVDIPSNFTVLVTDGDILSEFPNVADVRSVLYNMDDSSGDSVGLFVDKNV
jgi:hypothetical protein